MYNGDILRDAIISGANNLFNHKKSVDDLNVFPVPDGDTGTNMSLTLQNSVSVLKEMEGESAAEVAKTNASALLRGARGNSGVITSLLFRGFAKGITKDEITAEELKNAFSFGVEAAYKAVMKPTEGTILTVARVGSEKASEALSAGADVLGVFEAAFDGAKEALAETPELLPTLKQAGVVDAGGQGYVYILEGMLSVLRDNKIIENEGGEVEISTEQTYDESVSAAGEFETEITFTYCTEFIVNRDKKIKTKPQELRSYLESIGDCVVVVDDEEIIKVHVHTDHPGNAIEKGLTFGQLVHLKIENMRDQHEKAKHDAEVKRKKEAAGKKAKAKKMESVEISKPVGYVSVCAGSGLAQLFSDLGVDNIVSGGQTMNPSTDDILNAIEATPAETVYVLPNNKNIIMAAEQAIPLSSRNVYVLHTRTVPQGVAAMLKALDFEGSSDNEAQAIEMQKASEKIATGSITFAARDSEFDGHDIKQGEIMALIEGKLSFLEEDLNKAASKLLKQMLKKNSQFVTVYYGDAVTEEAAAALEEEMTAKWGDKVEITFVKGDQPVYYFIISVE